MAIAEHVYRGITGRSPATEPRSFAGMLAALMRAAGGPRMTRRAGELVGVSQRTVQKWLKGTQKPSRVALGRLQDLQRRFRLSAAHERNIIRANDPRVLVRYANEDRRRWLDARSLKWSWSGVGDVVSVWLEGNDPGVVRAFLQAIGDSFYREAIAKGEDPDRYSLTDSDPVLIVEEIRFRAK